MKVEESWRKLKLGDFWQKWQAYSLTFWPKLLLLRHSLSLDESWKSVVGNLKKVETRRFLAKMASL